MADTSNRSEASVCPKTGKVIRPRKHRWSLWVWIYPIVAIASLIWFLVRVLPKPSRAAYPCQRVAAPLASSFVVWVTGVLASTVAFHRAANLLRRSRYVVATLAVVVGAVSMYLAVHSTPIDDAAAYTYDDRYAVKPANSPLGVGQGIHPGRVVWVRDTDATDWDGVTGYWRDEGNTDPDVVDDMVSDALRWLTGEYTDQAAWQALFEHLNAKRGKGAVGYVAGEKIAIKLNLVATGTPDANGYQTQYLQYTSHSKEMIHSLLAQLIDVAGVPQEDISIGDPTNMFPGQFYDYLSADYPNVHYMTNTVLPGRELVQFSDVELHWSTPDAAGTRQDYFTQYYANAEYFINFAILKAHWAAITQCGKNHYGSLTRRPDATGDGYFDMHASLTYLQPNDASYRALVDLMGHEHTGGKTLLYLQDGLWGGYGWGGVSPPVKWRSAPFNNDYPSSVLMSQDPVAIDSVGFDLWYEEDKVSWNYSPFNTVGKEHFPHLTGGCDYLREAALAGSPPSGTFYDPEGDGTRLTSLGVHEHRNANMQYSRNLGFDEGIELITSSPLPEPEVVGRYVFYNNSAFDDNDPAANEADDDAIAPDKTPLLGEGVTATFANYTSYDRGINGLMIDIANMPGVPTAADFACQFGDTRIWTLLPPPAVSVRPGAGYGGADRVTLTWPDGTIRNTWLQVTVLSTEQTGLAEEDVFYFGNAPGETGDSTTDAMVTEADALACAAHPCGFTLEHFVQLKTHFGMVGVTWTDGDFSGDGAVTLEDFVILKNNFGSSTGVANPYDIDRDGFVNEVDQAICRANLTDAASALPLLALAGPPVDVTMIETGSQWSYLDDGSDQGSAWREPAFVPSGWATGQAQLGYGDGDEQTVVSYGGDSSNKYITTYFRHEFTVSEPLHGDTLTVNLLRDDGAIVYLNGVEIVRTNMPTGTVDYLTGSTDAMAGTNETTYFPFTGINASLLAAGTNVLAVEIHQHSGTSSDISFDLELICPAD